MAFRTSLVNRATLTLLHLGALALLSTGSAASIPESGDCEPKRVTLTDRKARATYDTGDGYCRVGGVSRRASSDLLELHLEGAERPLVGTSEHPVYDALARRFWPLGVLRSGTLLASPDGQELKVLDVVARESHQPVRVFNLLVEGAHNFYAASAKALPFVLTHNNDRICPPVGRAGVEAAERRVTGYHGTDGDTIISIIESGVMRPHREAVQLSGTSYQAAFAHGGDIGRRATFSLEIEVGVSSASRVSRSSTPGVPDTLTIRGSADLPVHAKRLFVRRPDGDGGFITEAIEGQEAILSYLRGQ